MIKVKPRIDIEEIKQALISLSEADLEQVIRDARMSRLRAKLKTIEMRELEGLEGIMSIGGDAVRDTEKYYE